MNSSSPCGMTWTTSSSATNSPPGGHAIVQGIGFIQLADDAAGIRGVRGLQGLQGVFLGFFDVGADFVIIGCHWEILIPMFCADGKPTYTIACVFPRHGS